MEGGGEKVRLQLCLWACGCAGEGESEGEGEKVVRVRVRGDEEEMREGEGVVKGGDVRVGRAEGAGWQGRGWVRVGGWGWGGGWVRGGVGGRVEGCGAGGVITFPPEAASAYRARVVVASMSRARQTAAHALGAIASPPNT